MAIIADDALMVKSSTKLSSILPDAAALSTTARTVSLRKLSWLSRLGSAVHRDGALLPIGSEAE
jgi:hypothetical protein